MQIFPTDSSSGASIFFSGADSGGGDFMQAMQNALQAVSEGENVSASSAMAEESGRPVVESPYTMHSDDGVTYTLGEVCFTKRELQELRERLLKEGAPEECLRQFDILADQPDGATLAQVMASLMGKTAAQLSDDDVQAITALLGKIDPSGSLAQDVLARMAQGDGPGALDLIQSALGGLGADETMDIDLEGLLALGRGLGLNADAMRGLVENMGGASSLSLTASQFDALMGPAKNQFMTDAANAEKLDAALEKTLKPIIARARDRMEKEKAASELRNRRVEQSRVLIDRTVRERGRNMMDRTVAGENGETDTAALKNGMTGHAGENGKNVQIRENSQAERAVNGGQARNNASNAQNAANVQNAASNANAAFSGKDQGSQDSGWSGLRQDAKNDAWQDLLGKTETRPAATSGQDGGSIVYAMLQGNAAQEQPAAMTRQPGAPQLSRQLAGQVEQGMLTAMRDGATRLDLQLHPAELGALTITLIARNGEVTAQIRSEKSETAEMVTRQLDTIRVNLEQQGVKVDKIEVQLQNQRDNGDASFQMDQHNQRQEEDARQAELTRLRNLAAMRNNRGNEESSILARHMQNMGYAARYAGQAVHVVA